MDAQNMWVERFNRFVGAFLAVNSFSILDSVLYPDDHRPKDPKQQSHQCFPVPVVVPWKCFSRPVCVWCENICRCRVCDENNALMATLEARSEEMRKMTAEKMGENSIVLCWRAGLEMKTNYCLLGTTDKITFYPRVPTPVSESLCLCRETSGRVYLILPVTGPCILKFSAGRSLQALPGWPPSPSRVHMLPEQCPPGSFRMPSFTVSDPLLLSQQLFQSAQRLVTQLDMFHTTLPFVLATCAFPRSCVHDPSRHSPSAANCDIILGLGCCTVK